MTVRFFYMRVPSVLSLTCWIRIDQEFVPVLALHDRESGKLLRYIPFRALEDYHQSQPFSLDETLEIRITLGVKEARIIWNPLQGPILTGSLPLAMEQRFQ